MQIHDIKPDNSSLKKKRVGRGGKRGTYSGKGMKGQKSRAGTHKKEPLIRRIIKRYPKLRGYKFSPLSQTHSVSISLLQKKFDTGAEINPTSLIEKGIIAKSKKFPVKIIGKCEITKKLHIKECNVSAGAKEIIEKAGGTVEIMPEKAKTQKDKIKSKKSKAKT